MSATAEKTRIIIAVPPLFLNQKDAGEYLNRSDDFLRVNAARHDLYKSSVPHKGQGSPCHYHRDHLDIIARHLMDPEIFTEDAALIAWRRIRANAISGLLSAAGGGKVKSGKTQPRNASPVFSEG